MSVLSIFNFEYFVKYLLSEAELFLKNSTYLQVEHVELKEFLEIVADIKEVKRASLRTLETSETLLSFHPSWFRQAGMSKE